MWPFKKKRSIEPHGLIIGIDFSEISFQDAYNLGKAIGDTVRSFGKEIRITVYETNGDVETRVINADKANSSSL